MAAWVALQSDTDCDGTTWSAKRYSSEEEARKDQYGYAVQTEAEFMASESYSRLDDWSKDYWAKEGYASLGARWNPWVYDDSIGIPALDHTAEDDLSDLARPF